MALKNSSRKVRSLYHVFIFLCEVVDTTAADSLIYSSDESDLIQERLK